MLTSVEPARILEGHEQEIGAGFSVQTANESSNISNQWRQKVTCLAPGMVSSMQDVLSVGAITKHFARAVELLKVPWPARPDSKPIVTPQDVTNICKVRAQLSRFR